MVGACCCRLLLYCFISADLILCQATRAPLAGGPPSASETLLSTGLLCQPMRAWLPQMCLHLQGLLGLLCTTQHAQAVLSSTWPAM